MTMVIAEHCGLLPFGWTGVWLFYVISGFVISRNFIAERDAGASAPTHYLSFLVRRFFRIVPPYATYIALNCILIAVMGSKEQYGDLPYLATFSFNWQMILGLTKVHNAWSAFGHLWTISVEEQFYVVFPLLFFGLRGRAFPNAMFVVLLIGPIVRWALIHYLIAHGFHDPDQLAFATYASSFGQFDAFAIGTLLAHYEGSIHRRPEIAARLFWASITILSVYCAVYLLINHYVRGASGIQAFRWIVSGTLYGQGRELFLYSTVDLVAVAIVALAISDFRSLRLLGAPFLSWVGRVSYAGYLYHALILLLIGSIILHGPARSFAIQTRLEVFCVVWAGTVLVASLSYRYIEKGAMRIGHRISARLLSVRKPTTVPVATPAEAVGT